MSAVLYRLIPSLFGYGIVLLFSVLLLDWMMVPCSAQESAASSARLDLESKVIEAFGKTADGWSVDEVMLHDERRRAFLDSCKSVGAEGDEKQLFETLLRVRKGGRLEVRSTRSERVSVEDYTIAAEIAARRVGDERKVHFDEILCDPELLNRFDTLAGELSPDVENYLFRKAALRLRKSRQLRPELAVQANDWRVRIHDYTLDELTAQLSQVTSRPGIYIFRDASGYLYIGQTNNLRERLTHHLEQSDRDQLRRYLLEKSGVDLRIELHEFEDGSPGEKLAARRAYESELIRSREPRLNLAP